VNCLNAPYCEHKAECSPTVCDSFVPVPANDRDNEGGEPS